MSNGQNGFSAKDSNDRCPRVGRCFRFGTGVWLWLSPLVLTQTFKVQAQETSFHSLAGEQTAEARHKAQGNTDYYNLKLRPTTWIFNAALGLEMSDNLRLEHANPQSDLIFRPEAGAQISFPFSDKNSIKLAAIAGYSAYLKHSEYDRWYINPGSELSFDLYIGDFWVNLHDRFQILEDSYQDPTVIGVADYSQLQNAVGITTLWDLNKLFLKMGYDHVNDTALRGNHTTAAQHPDARSELLSISAGFQFEPGMSAGLEVGGNFVRYSKATSSQFFTDGVQFNVGGSIEAQVTEHLSASGRIGYTLFSPEPNAQGQAAADFRGVYARVSIAHRVNRFLEFDVSGGRNLNFSLYSGTIDLASARLAANWKLLWKTRFTTSFDFEHGAQIAADGEVFNRYGPGMSLGRDITRQLNSSITYQFYCRNSNLPDRDYTVNIAILELSYRF